MSLSVAFVREMSVGKRKITNAELRAVFIDAGFTRAETFRGTGNVVFLENGREEERVKRIQTAFKSAVGKSVPTFLRTSSDVRKIADLRPFTDDQIQSAKGKPHVLMLGAAPSKKSTAAVLRLATDTDALAVVGTNVFWLPMAGTGKSQLDLQAVEALVGLGALRSVGTLQGVLKKLK